MTVLVHVVGSQGIGKSMLMAMIESGAAGKAAVVECDDAHGMTNAQLREAHPDKPMVLVEAHSLQPRHADLAPGDLLMTLSAGAPI